MYIRMPYPFLTHTYEFDGSAAPGRSRNYKAI